MPLEILTHEGGIARTVRGRWKGRDLVLYLQLVCFVGFRGFRAWPTRAGCMEEELVKCVDTAYGLVSVLRCMYIFRTIVCCRRVGQVVIIFFVLTT